MTMRFQHKLLFSVFIFALCCAVAVVWRQNSYPTKGIDDANIFFSYAENIAHGAGFVYAHNPEPVEGFTSLFWTLLCGVCFASRANEAGVFVLAIFLLVGTQWICWHLLARILQEKGIHSRLPFAVYATGILSSTGYVTWMSITLMDVALWSFFLASFAWLLHNACLREVEISTRPLLCGIIPFALAPAVRPEFMAAVPALLGLLFLHNLFLKRPLRHIFIWGGVFLVSLGVLTVFRCHHFGYPLPNTFYAKVSPSLTYNLDMGIQYALPFFISGVFPALFCAVLVGRLASFVCEVIRPRADSPQVAGIGASDMLLLWTAVLSLLPILAGGDHFDYFRFYQPIYPLICLGLIAAIPATGWDSVYAKRSKVFLGGVLLALLPLSWNFSASYLQSHWQRLPFTREFSIAEAGIHRGKLFNSLFADAPRLPNVGVIVAGGIARTYEGPLTDLMGLNNTTVAHYPGNREGTKNHAAFELGVFPELNVDAIDDSIDDVTSFSFVDKVLKHLFETPAFASEWCFGHLANLSNNTSGKLWFRRAFLDTLLKSPNYKFRDLKFWDGVTWLSSSETENPEINIWYPEDKRL